MKSRPVSFLKVDNEDKQEILRILKKHKVDINPESLLKCAESSKGFLSICAVKALAFTDATDVISRLKVLVQGRSSDMATVALITIARLAGAKENQYYISLIRSKTYKDKLVLASILWEVGDDSALPEMRYLADQIILGEIKHVELDNDPLYISEYLHKYSQEVKDLERIEQLERLYRKNAWGYLEYLKHWISKHKKG